MASRGSSSWLAKPRPHHLLWWPVSRPSCKARKYPKAHPPGVTGRWHERPVRTVAASSIRVTQQPDELAAHRELRAWRRAAEHLNAHGVAAAVPPELVDVLRRRGLAVWPAGRRAA